MADGGEPAAVTSTEAFSAKQLRFLKLAIVVMTTILVLGFAAVIGRIVYLVATSAPSPSKGTTLPASMRLELPRDAHVRSLSLAGDRLAVHYESPQGSGIAIVDLAAGQSLSNIELAPQAAER
jgi:hypothetical protein